MNEHTAVLLQGLADKLGTTSTYLWSVLLKQAPVYAWVTLAEYVLTALLLLTLYRFRKTIGPWLSELVEESEVLGVLVIIASGVALTVWLIACVFVFQSVVTAFVNPEYWALDKVLDTVKARK